MMLLAASNTITCYVRKISNLFRRFKLEKVGYRYSLINVSFINTSSRDILLHVLIQGIKKEILSFTPDEIVNDDEFLFKFSPCDIRAIAYLAFHKYISHESFDLIIVSQLIINGETVFVLSEPHKNEVMKISARKLYQCYELLTKLSKKDMINVISTAVQEQTILDLENMNLM